MAFDIAIRHFLSGFRLPGESQKIDRLMEAFAERYVLLVDVRAVAFSLLLYTVVAIFYIEWYTRKPALVFFYHTR